MKSFNFNNVQTDKQWRRRCQVEEMQLLDSYAGPKAHKIQTQVTLQNSQHFYSNGARIAVPQMPHPEEAKDDLCSIRTKVSVKTPSYVSSARAKSHVSYRSNMTTKSTKDKMVAL
jgi:hypothetical protein